MLTRSIHGCAYRTPEPDTSPTDIQTAVTATHTNLPLPSDKDFLRAAQLWRMAPQLIGKPIRISHNDSGIIRNPCHPEQSIKTKLPLFGGTPLGYITHAWVQPSTNSLHFAATLRYDTDSITGTILPAVYKECSLKHWHATNHLPAFPAEISVCFRGRRPNSNVEWQSTLDTYMRKTEYTAYHETRRTMESAAAAATAAAPQTDATPMQETPALDQNSAADFSLEEALKTTHPLIIEQLKTLVRDRENKAALVQKYEKQEAARKIEWLGNVVNIMAELGLDKTAFEKLNTDHSSALVAASAANTKETNAMWDYLHGFASVVHKEIQQRKLAPPPQQQPPSNDYRRAIKTQPGDLLPADYTRGAKRAASDNTDHTALLGQLRGPPPAQHTINVTQPQQPMPKTAISESTAISASNAESDFASILSHALFEHANTPRSSTMNGLTLKHLEAKPLPASRNIVFEGLQTIATALKP